MKTVLTIAGSDCSGGAGIQADIKTITMHGLYAMSAVTALTAQNTTGVYGIADVEPDFLKQQLNCIFTDIFPDAVKIGMVSNASLIQVIAEALERYRPGNIVIDPVMVSTSGRKLLQPLAQKALLGKLLPLADLVTPNIPEAEVLSGNKIESREDIEASAAGISKGLRGTVLIKGGHSKAAADDYLYIRGEGYWFCGERFGNPNTHGTGCTLSSAIACNLASGMGMAESVECAKDFLTGAIKDGMNLGKGDGPLNHMYGLPTKRN